MAMMEHLLSSIIVCLLISTAFAITVRLNGPKYTRRNDVITFNCSTDTPSVGLEAEILINSKTYTNMRTHNNICFSAVQGVGCAEDVYFSGPTLNVGSPLVAGTTARVTCQVLTNLKDVNLSWNCVNNGHENKTKTSNQYLSALTFIVKPFHQNTNCTCTGSFEEYHISSAVLLDVNSPPIILSTKIATENGVTITVKFYSTSDIKRPVWFSMSEPISDSTGVNVTIYNTTLALPVHNREIKCKGYVAKIYHSAPESMEDDHVYERTNPQYLELSEILQERHYSDIKEEEDELQLSRSDDWEDYEEID
ncbi:unnamed protein product [Mytilus edulis]|uniref:Ig-like domain-containing protein n=1 Tax=Mytilus edulis TaxID=6550 RepID=A0A8S3RZE4_MYTED|nr:unnamed protein product [Mytilus edulis]